MVDIYMQRGCMFFPSSDLVAYRLPSHLRVSVLYKHGQNFSVSSFLRSLFFLSHIFHTLVKEVLSKNVKEVGRLSHGWVPHLSLLLVYIFMY